jgi:hypothetical protein
MQQTVPGQSGSTTINAVHLTGSTITITITNKFLLKQILFTCRICSNLKVFGFSTLKLEPIPSIWVEP